MHQQRQAHQRDNVQCFCFFKQGAQGIQCTGLQRALQKQVAAGIAGQAELGEYGQLYAAGCGFVQSIRDLPDIIGAVGHPVREKGRLLSKNHLSSEDFTSCLS